MPSILPSLARHAGRVVRRLPDLAQDYVYAARHIAASLVARVGPGGPQPPVLLLPGIYERAGFLGPLRSALEADGNSVHTVAALRLNLAEPADLARIVAEELEARDLRGVVCVAHSKGGLLAKQLLIDPRTRDRIAGAVCLCTPFGGSGWGALFLPGLGVRELRPAGPLIAALMLSTEANRRIVSIYPTLDPHIPEGSRLEGATNVELEGFGHFKVLSDPRFLDAATSAVRRLRGGEPA